MQSKKRLITQAEFARQRGVTPARICHLVKAGVIRLVDGKVDPEAADKAIAAASDPSRDDYRKMPGRPVDKGTSAGSDYRKAATAEKYWAAMLKKMAAEEREGELVNAKDMERELTGLFTTIKTRIRAIAPKISQKIVHLKMGKKNQRQLTSEVQEIIKTEADEALQELSEWGNNKCEAKNDKTKKGEKNDG